jgi:hypothetical protein
MAKYRIDSREDWLNAAVAELRPAFAKAGYVMHQKVRVSCGWPGGRSGKGGRRIGECWARESSADGTFEMFISPALADPSRVLDVLVHELVHVAVGLRAGHKAPFAKCAAAMYLKGPWTATTKAEGFDTEIEAPVLKALGCAYPHAELRRGESTGPKKQGTRLVKVTCAADGAAGGCGAVFRITHKWIEAAHEHENGLRCPVCSGLAEAQD